MIISAFDTRKQHGLWLTVKHLNEFVLETYRILYQLDSFSKLENVQESNEYQTIENMLQTAFEEMFKLGRKYGFISDVFKEEKDASMTEIFAYKRCFKSVDFIDLGKLSTLMSEKPEDAYNLFYELKTISDKVGSYSEVMETLEPNIHSHLDYNNFNHFHKSCSYTRVVHDLIKGKE